MKFLVNPKHRRVTRRRKRPVPSGFKSWSAYMDHIRSFKKGARKMARKRRKVRRHRSNEPVRRRVHRKRRYVRNDPGPRRKRYGRKRHRSNPRRMPTTVMGFGTLIMNGVIDAAEVVVGKAGVRIIPQTLGIPVAGTMGLGVQVLSAVVLGWLGTFISSNASKMLLAGGLASPVEDMIKTLNIPFISPALGEDVVEISAYPQLMGYETPYPSGMGEVGEDEAYSVQQ